ncbi:hypothetical protein QJS04_geneDACA012800 [Acorus gramineus]|uniref:Uncharacterized protein n=1 Tax=Acorus gramineus TaxID=55184 RepID=A0AAV9BJ25_ACOGR|nr:hypothetical protein QJS04_geneDACA012800 [Acorus gramineus]
MAVVCLDGDGCKIRNELSTIEENSTLDTSIACDSCDKWCICDRVPLNSDVISIRIPVKQCGHTNSDPGSIFESVYSGKVSVSVADDGETAVVVSMVEGKHGSGASENIPLESSQYICTKKEINTCNESVSHHMRMSENGLSTCEKTANVSSQDTGAPHQSSPNLLPKNPIVQPEIDIQEISLGLSLLHDVSLSSLTDSVERNDLKSYYNEKPMCELGSDECKNLALCETSSIKSNSENKSQIDLHLGLSVGSSLADTLASDATVGEDGNQKMPLDVSLLPADKMAIVTNESLVGVNHRKNTALRSAKRKIADKYKSSARDNGVESNKVMDLYAKKARSGENFHMPPLLRRGKNTVSDESAKGVTISKYDKLKHVQAKEDASSDIMSIVQGIERRSSPRNTIDNSKKESNNSDGLRMKKILRRVGDDNETSVLLQKLRNEIREAAHDKVHKDLSKSDAFDGKLLDAFRKAILKHEIETTRRIDPCPIQVKKPTLQKGKIRENLTKKIYGTSSGRRRHAWDRDRNIEFWKPRCMTSQPQKVETLLSVLDLLKRSSDSSLGNLGIEHGEEPKDSILSRVYLADTSLFPRKGDIKPLSVTGVSSTIPLDMNKEKKLVKGLDKDSLPICENHLQQISKGNASSTDKNDNARALEGGAGGKKVELNGQIQQRPSLKDNSQILKDSTGQSGDVKSDKRKWALEVLARKTASLNQGASHGQTKDDDVFKGRYPLLAQLPMDMRPALMPSRHSKVPKSVRQAQLYRLAEHYLKNANLHVIRRTADTELAVADAVNVEKEICDRSNSKLVYVNLCSQVCSQHANHSKCNAEAAPESEHATKEESEPPTVTCDNVEDALRSAGLTSDSPPNSPHRSDQGPSDDGSHLAKGREEDPTNILDVDSHPELDIYGDFEYDMEEEGYIDPGIATNFKASNVKPENEESKMKVVFSTLNRVDTEKPEMVEPPAVSPTSEHSQMETEADPHWEEELYGPDKEPLIKRIPELTSIDPSKVHAVHEDEKCRPDSGATENNNPSEEMKTDLNVKELHDPAHSILKKVEAYVKEHLRPLCKSGVITVEQYRWAVGKTTDKVMRYHSKEKNANFLIKEGEKVKKLAVQYIEAAQQQKQHRTGCE